MASLSFCALQFRSMAVPTIRMPCSSNCVSFLSVSFLTLVDSFGGGLLVRLLVGLHVIFLRLVDSFRCSSLIGLLVQVHVSFLSHIDGFGGGLLVGLLVTILTLVYCFCVGSPVGLLVDGFLCCSLVGLLVGVPISFFSPIDGFCGGSLLTLRRGHPLVCEFSCLPIAYGFTDVLHTAVLVNSCPYDPHTVLIELRLFAVCLLAYTRRWLSGQLARQITSWITGRIARQFSCTYRSLSWRLSRRLTRRNTRRISRHFAYTR